MNNKQKKIAAGALVAFLAVSGTAAFFTSSDLITNIFATGSTLRPEDPNAGIDVNEQFSGYTPGLDGILGTDDDVLVEYDNNPNGVGEVTVEKVTVDGVDTYVKKDADGNVITTYVPNENGSYTGPNGEKVVIGTAVDRDGNEIFVVGPAEVLPGQSFVKEVGIDSEANYNQFVRAKVVVAYDIPTGTVAEDGTAITAADAAKYVKVTYNSAAAVEGGDGVWQGTVPAITDFSGNGASSEWFYYSKVLGATPARTADLIKAVELTADAPNWMKNVKFTVTVEGESVQASAAYWNAGDWTTTAPIPTAVDND
ncbi:MAG: hypothetical protein ACRDCC_07800 [Culicoidibacterales bacterium]